MSQKSGKFQSKSKFGGKKTGGGAGDKGKRFSKPFEGDKRGRGEKPAFGRGDRDAAPARREEGGRSFGDKKSFGKKPFGKKPFGGDRARDGGSSRDRPFREGAPGERKFGDKFKGPRPDRASGGERTFRDRKPREDRETGSRDFKDRKPRGDREFGSRDFKDRKPREDRETGSRDFKDRKPRGDREFGNRDFKDRKPREDREFGNRDFKDRKPRGDREFGNRDFKDRKPEGDREFKDRKFGDRKPFGDRKFGDKKFGDKKFGDKKFGDKKFGDRKFGDRKFGDKKFGDKKFSDKKSDDKKFAGPAGGARPWKRYAEAAPAERADASAETRERLKSGRPALGAPSAAFLYGAHAVRAALLNPARSHQRLLCTSGGYESIAEASRKAAEEGLTLPEATFVEAEDITRLLPRDAVHQGLLLDSKGLEEVFLSDIINAAGPDARIVVLDQVTDPHNVGAVLRSVAAFGAVAVVMQKLNAPDVTGVLAKAASGAVEHVPIVREVNLSRAIAQLKEAAFFCVGLAEEGSEPLSRALPKQGRVALVLGAEGDGLRRLVAEGCDVLARLPTGGPIGSLNVSNAAAAALYELARDAK